MLGIIDREIKNVHVFRVLDNRNKETLLPLIDKNVYTEEDIKVNHYDSSEDIHKNCFSNRIYSDCYGAYQIEDFKDL